MFWKLVFNANLIINRDEEFFAWKKARIQGLNYKLKKGIQQKLFLQDSLSFETVITSSLQT